MSTVQMQSSHTRRALDARGAYRSDFAVTLAGPDMARLRSNYRQMLVELKLARGGWMPKAGARQVVRSALVSSVHIGVRAQVRVFGVPIGHAPDVAAAPTVLRLADRGTWAQEESDRGDAHAHG